MSSQQQEHDEWSSTDSDNSDWDDTFIEHSDLILDEGEYSGDESLDDDNSDSGSEPNALRPYMFEPTVESTENNEVEDDGEDPGIDVMDNVTANNDRIDNNSWCICGECCPMQTSVESICCKEIALIPDDNFEGW